MRVRLVVLKVEPAQVAGPLHPVLHWRDWGATYGRKLTDLYVNDLKETKREYPYLTSLLAFGDDFRLRW